MNVSSSAKEKRVSVIVVNYNGKKWLQACLESVFTQQLDSEFEIDVFLIDNNSDDGSASFVKENFSTVRVIELENNLGFGSGCKIGVENSHGELLLFLNNDTIMTKGTLLGLVDDLEVRELDAVAAIEVPYEGGTSSLVRTTIDVLGFPVYLYEGDKFAQGKSFYLSAVCLLVKRTTFLESGGFDVSFFMYYEDTDLFWRMQLLGYSFDYSRRSTIRHAGHGSTGGRTLSYQRFLWRNTNLPKMLLKNLKFFNLTWVIPLYFVSCLFECVVLFLVGRRDLARSYVSCLGPIFRDIGAVISNRRKYQKLRTVGDLMVFKRMYPGLGKFKGLRHKAFGNSQSNLHG